jgi:hypothetical protein
MASAAPMARAGPSRWPGTRPRVLTSRPRNHPSCCRTTCWCCSRSRCQRRAPNWAARLVASTRSVNTTVARTRSGRRPAWRRSGTPGPAPQRHPGRHRTGSCRRPATPPAARWAAASVASRGAMVVRIPAGSSVPARTGASNRARSSGSRPRGSPGRAGWSVATKGHHRRHLLWVARRQQQRQPAAARTQRRSSIQSSNRCPVGPRSDRPVPRRSYRISRQRRQLGEEPADRRVVPPQARLVGTPNRNTRSRSPRRQPGSEAASVPAAGTANRRTKAHGQSLRWPTQALSQPATKTRPTHTHPARRRPARRFTVVERLGCRHPDRGRGAVGDRVDVRGVQQLW